MCMYSAASEGPDIGALTPFHLVHLGAFALRGAALVCVEATSVLPNGRLSPQDSGIWNDRQRDALKPIFSFIKMQGAVPAIQLYATLSRLRILIAANVYPIAQWTRR
jgi:2,4-dienoyl-CoA reductase-like NADH-dependent reductase (Old Yellow Enzyme family)